MLFFIQNAWPVKLFMELHPTNVFRTVKKNIVKKHSIYL